MPRVTVVSGARRELTVTILWRSPPNRRLLQGVTGSALASIWTDGRPRIGMSGKRRAVGRGGEALWGRFRSRLPASGQSGVWVFGREALSGAVVYEAMV